MWRGWRGGRLLVAPPSTLSAPCINNHHPILPPSSKRPIILGPKWLSLALPPLLLSPPP